MSRIRTAAARGAYAALIAFGAAVLAACGHSSPTRFFTLDPLPPAGGVAAAYAGPPIKLVAVHIPPSLDREELVSEGPSGVVQVHDFEHWEASLGLTARQALTQDLVARLPAGAVLAPSAPGDGRSALLSAEVLAFQATGGEAVMQAAWSVSLPAAGPAPAASRNAPPAELRTPVTGSDGAAVAQAFSTLLAQLSDRIATSLPATLADLSAERAAARAAAARALPPRVQRTTRTTTTTATRRPPG